MDTAITLQSGGMDSAVCLGFACSSYSEIIPLFIDYGQQIKDLELHMAQKQVEHMREQYPLVTLKDVRVIDYRPIVNHFSEGIASEVESFETEDGEMVDGDGTSTAYVPMRNLHFLSTAAGVASTEDADAIYLGVQGGDEDAFPDCRPDFIDFARRSINASMPDGEALALRTPILHASKEAVIQYGDKYGVDWKSTWSCYQNENDIENPKPCNECPSCKERTEAFNRADAQDPHGEEE